MEEKKVKIALRTDITYVSGRINGVDKVFTLNNDGLWEATTYKSYNSVYEIELYAVDVLNRSATYSTTLFLGLDLIFDRTADDVTEARQLINKYNAGKALSDAEKQKFDNSLKGTYSFIDFNRVETAADIVSRMFEEHGYSTNISTKTDWKENDLINVNDRSRYFNNIKVLRNIMKLFKDTPQAPTVTNKLTYQQANDIELILRDAYIMIINIDAQPLYSDTFYSGEY